jgi:hypothetical protein
MNFIKQPDEKFTVSINFNSNLEDGETIDTYTIEATQAGEIQENLIDSSSSQSGYVNIKVKNGTNNTDYKITVKITTSDNNVYEEDVIMQVRDK